MRQAASFRSGESAISVLLLGVQVQEIQSLLVQLCRLEALLIKSFTADVCLIVLTSDIFYIFWMLTYMTYDCHSLPVECHVLMAFLRHANNSINLDHYDMKRRYSPRAVLSQIVVTIHGPLGKNSIYAPRSRARNLSKKQFFPFTQRPCFRDVPLLANEQNNFTKFHTQ